MIKTNTKTTFLMTSIILSAVLVMGVITPAYAGSDESPLGCSENAVTQSFGITEKITAAGQKIIVLTANIGNPSDIVSAQERNCDYTVTAQEVVVDKSGVQTTIMVNGGANDCVGATVTPGNSQVCTFIPSDGWTSDINFIVGDTWTLRMITDRLVAVPGTDLPDTATTSDATLLAASDVTLTKSVNPDKILKGANTSVEYTYVTKNTGDTDLICGLVDDKLGEIYASKALAPNAEDTTKKSTTLTAGVTNIAKLTCLDQAEVELTRTATAIVKDISPKVTLDKSVKPDKITKGVATAVTYSYKVTNTGDTNLDCTVTDDKIGDVGTTKTLIPNAEETLTKGAIISNAVTNIGTVDCKAQIGGAKATSTVTVKEIEPAIDVDKTCTPLTQQAPGTITWNIVVTNTGNTELTGVVLTDATLGINKNIGTLAAGASDTTTESQSNLAAGIYTNTASADGFDQLQTKVTDSDPASCEVVGGGSEGLTPGFWKANAENWDAGAWIEDPTEKFNAVFGTSVELNLPKADSDTPIGTSDDPTLYGALGARGGGENALARHCVAAKLNAEEGHIDYPMSRAQVIADCADALNNGTPEEINTLKDLLDTQNNLGADIDQHHIAS